jgi:hypothetical protein
MFYLMEELMPSVLVVAEVVLEMELQQQLPKQILQHLPLLVAEQVVLILQYPDPPEVLVVVGRQQQVLVHPELQGKEILEPLLLPPFPVVVEEEVQVEGERLVEMVQ